METPSNLNIYKIISSVPVGDLNSCYLLFVGLSASRCKLLLKKDEYKKTDICGIWICFSYRLNVMLHASFFQFVTVWIVPLKYLDLLDLLALTL